nr:MAG TPA: hypothetical protein [Crassvirales sp.]
MSFHQSLHVLLPNNQQSKPKCPIMQMMGVADY